MRIAILSDIHWEIDPSFVPPDVGADLTVWAGDIHRGHLAPAAIMRYTKTKENILIAGNHEAYKEEADIDAVNATIAAGCYRHAQDPAVQFLQNSSVEIQDTLFLGCTLWTDFRLNHNEEEKAKLFNLRYMNDSRLIKGFQTDDVQRRHFESVAWLTRTMENWVNEKHNRRMVVVTHMAPSPQSIHPKWQGDRVTKLLNASFASNLEPLINEYQPLLWIHGHTHDSFDYFVGNTRIVANPKGYYDENQKFNPKLVVEV